MVLRRVRVADKGCVVPPGEGAVERRSDASVGLCADDDESPNSKARQDALERGVLKGVAVALCDERLGRARSQLRDDLPVVAPARKLFIGVLDPDNGNAFPPRLLDKTPDVRDDCVTLVSPRDDAALHVDDEERCFTPILECRHGLPLLAPASTQDIAASLDALVGRARGTVRAVDPDQARQLLEDERERIESAIADLGGATEAGEENEPGERDSEGLYQKEFDEGRADDLREQLEAVERAQARLAAGTYGLSVESGEPIPDARLESMPTAERTVEEEDRRG